MIPSFVFRTLYFVLSLLFHSTPLIVYNIEIDSLFPMYNLPLETVLKKLKTSFDGLTSKEAAHRLVQYGFNTIALKKENPWWKVLLRQFMDLMVSVLLIAGLIAFLLGENTDGIIITVIVIFNALIGFVQEFKAERVLEKLQKMIDPHTNVLRNKKALKISSLEVVPGDILLLEEGDRVPADALLLESHQLHCDESALTGESVPVHKHMELLGTSRWAITNSSRCVFMGTYVTSGVAKAIVLYTGLLSRFGKIAHLTQTTHKISSPLQKEMLKMGLFVSKLALIFSVLLFLIGIFLRNQSWNDSLLFAVSVATAAVPEGLPAAVTVALAIGIQRIARKKAIIRQLASVETLGSTTVICSDKTGTLTENKMTVEQVYLSDGTLLKISGAGYDLKQHELTLGKHYFKNARDLFVEYPAHQTHLQKLCLVNTLCNEAKLEIKKQRGEIVGDPTEGALLILTEKLNYSVSDLQSRFQILKKFSFDSAKKRMSVVVQSTKYKVQSTKWKDGFKIPDSKFQILTKGAPDVVLKLCSHYLENDQIKKLTETKLAEIKKHYDEMAREALRVLACAYKPINTPFADQSTAEKNLIFLGLEGMLDPPREEVKEAVITCRTAGIRVIVITGDYGLTAEAIARKLGIIHNQHYQTIQGEELDKFTPQKLHKLLADKSQTFIFSRVSPEHKLQVVSALQKNGEIVAVTGDGVNDAPALKKADSGIAMGSGTDVSKEVANVVLTDNSFASIARAVREGRKIYDNLKKFSWFIFSCNTGELFTVFSAILLGIPMPLSAILILCVDLGTDILPVFALGVDHAEPNIMQRPPKDPRSHIMNAGFIKHFLSTGIFIGILVMLLYWFELYQGGWRWGETLSATDPPYLKASTVAFATLVIIQLFNVFNARSARFSIFKLGLFSNLYIWGAIFLSSFLVIGIVYLPVLQKILHTTALSGQEWLKILACTLMVLVWEEGRKMIVNSQSKANQT